MKTGETSGRDAGPHRYSLGRDLVVGTIRRPGAAVHDLKEIERHGLAGLMADAIQSGLLDVSPQVQSEILAIWRRQLLRSAIVDLEVERLGAALTKYGAQKRSLVPILLKGNSVASKYSNPLHRPYRDIDLLVHRSDLAMWGRALRDNGYGTDSPWRERHERIYSNHVVYVRDSSVGKIACELHSRICSLKSLLGFGYSPLASAAVSGPGELLHLTSAAQLVALAAHLLHHPACERRLIWYRDFFELGDAQTVRSARELSATWKVDWVLEWALGEAERLADKTIWNAREVRLQKGSLGALQRENAGLSLHFGLARELGPRLAMGYFLSKFDPRRFVNEDGNFHRDEFVAWLSRMRRLLMSTKLNRAE